MKKLGTEHWELTKEEYEQIKKDSPIKIGDFKYTHPEYGKSQNVEILDVSHFSRNEAFPFQYEVKFEDGEIGWIKGHCLVDSPNDSPETPETFVSKLLEKNKND